MIVIGEYASLYCNQVAICHFKFQRSWESIWTSYWVWQRTGTYETKNTGTKISSEGVMTIYTKICASQNSRYMVVYTFSKREGKHTTPIKYISPRTQHILSIALGLFMFALKTLFLWEWWLLSSTDARLTLLHRDQYSGSFSSERGNEPGDETTPSLGPITCQCPF